MLNPIFGIDFPIHFVIPILYSHSPHFPLSFHHQSVLHSLTPHLKLITIVIVVVLLRLLLLFIIDEYD